MEPRRRFPPGTPAMASTEPREHVELEPDVGRVPYLDDGDVGGRHVAS